MSMLWGLINAMQILVTVALINSSFPANCVVFYSMVSSLASFDVFPGGGFLFVLNFEEEEEPFNDRFELMGFKKANAVNNLGIIFLVFLCLGPIYLLFLLIQMLKGFSKMYLLCLISIEFSKPLRS